MKNSNLQIRLKESEKTEELQLSFMDFFIFEKDPSMAHELFPKMI